VEHEHYVAEEDPDEVASAPPVATNVEHGLRRWWWTLTHLMDDWPSGGFSSISPRRPDGTRTKPFFFNGNGMGR